MATSLLTDAEKAELENVRDDIFETFCRPLFVNVIPEMTILSSDNNYNYSYQAPEYQGNEDYINYTPNSGQFKACIHYADKLNRNYAAPMGTRDEGFRLTFDDGDVRIKLRKEDYDNYIKDAINFQFDGYMFDLDKTPRPHGLFDPKYYTLYLKFRN